MKTTLGIKNPNSNQNRRDLALASSAIMSLAGERLRPPSPAVLITEFPAPWKRNSFQAGHCAERQAYGAARGRFGWLGVDLFLHKFLKFSCALGKSRSSFPLATAKVLFR